MNRSFIAILFLFFTIQLLPAQDNLMYVAYSTTFSQGPDSILLLSIEEDGQLNELGRIATGGMGATGNTTVEFAYDQANQRLFSNNSKSKNMSVFDIGGEGALTPVSGSPFTTYFDNPVNIAVHPNGNFVYQAHFSGLSYYSTDLEGSLTFIDTLAANESYREMATQADSNWLYIAAMNKGVFGFEMDDETGSLTALPGSPYTYTSLKRTYEIRINTSKDTLFVKDLDSGIIIFTIQSDGSLQLVEDSPYSLGGFSIALGVSDDDRFLYTSSSGGNLKGFSVYGNPFMQNIFSMSGITPSYIIKIINPKGTDKLYCLENGHNIYVYTINDTGGVEEANFSPIELKIDDNYALSGVYFIGEVFTSITDGENYSIPSSMVLHPNYPNPFNPSTNIRYELQKPGQVELSIFDVTGRLVTTLVNGQKNAGLHNIVWNGKDRFAKTVSSGSYYLILKQNRSATVSRKMLLLK